MFTAASEVGPSSPSDALLNVYIGNLLHLALPRVIPCGSVMDEVLSSLLPWFTMPIAFLAMPQALNGLLFACSAEFKEPAVSFCNLGLLRLSPAGHPLGKVRTDLLDGTVKWIGETVQKPALCVQDYAH